MGTRHSRRSAIVLAGGLLIAPLAACSGAEENTGSSVLPSASEGVESATSAAASAAEDANADVDCSGTSCTVSLSPDAAEVEVLGTRLAYEGVQDGEATIAVGNRTVTCAEGESVEAGPLTLECTTVSEESISMTASLG
ncbi:hypothetical protein GCU60_17550 [Blastococcus saxobsidens]|uniref:Uncharacterized protein n=1 Tax=Blastococcus saxobsidens TaxID=138336 RepID=A0A6L9W6V8_9ACTN|nr:hypothetical protein [Blastococcus saxobsidens]NEK87549.1 hypothetical protein [Blastococcus saxobsidens]